MIWVYLVFAGRYVSGDVQDAFAVHPRFSTCWCFYWGPPHNSVNYYWYYYYYKLLLSYCIPHCFGSISRAEHMVKRYSLEFHESDVDFLMSCFTSSKMQTVANFLKGYFMICQIENYMMHFWHGIPEHLYSLTEYDVIADVICICDSVVYQVSCKRCRHRGLFTSCHPLLLSG